MLVAVLHRTAGVIPLRSLVLDGHFGNHTTLHMARPCDLHLLSKLRCDAALDLPSTAPYAGRGPRRKYGDKIDDDNLPHTPHPCRLADTI